LIRYAKEKGVRLRLWMHSGAAKAHMRQAFPLYEQWGIEGVMVDFVDKDDQETLNWEREMIALAAQHHLTVTFHNLSKPTGLSRTYPNLMTLEAVMNLEYDKWDPKGSTPEHELTIPFTRMLAGPVDYHSGSFRNVLASDFKPHNTAPVTIGTRARQLARYVVYEGYLPMAADSPGAYRGQLGLDALVQVPTTWDETRFLAGEVGQYAAIARRSGETWWVGAMTDSSACKLPISLRFLGRGRYRAEIWADAPDAAKEPTHLLTRKLTVTRKDAIPADLAPAGGVLIKLAPQD
jgi:alpha-glucosidase